MKLSILIAALTERRQDRYRLEDRLWYQIRNSPIEILVCEDDGALSSGAKRQRLLDQATGDYVCYLDDDDDVSPDYAQSLLGQIMLGPDVVTFDLERTDTGQIWSLGLRNRDRIPLKSGKMGMTANHLCAWRREIAQQVPWSDFGYADDMLWYMPLVASGLAEIESHIDRVLYKYQYDPKKTRNETRDKRKETYTRVAGGLCSYRWGDRIVVATSGRRQQKKGFAEVRDVTGKVSTVPVEELKLLTTVFS